MRSPAKLSAKNIGAKQSTHPRTLISTLQFAKPLVSLSKISCKDQVNVKYMHTSHDMRNPALLFTSKQKRHRSAYASAHSDQHLIVLCLYLFRKILRYPFSSSIY